MLSSVELELKIFKSILTSIIGKDERFPFLMSNLIISLLKKTKKYTI